MNIAVAKRILELHRPGATELADSELAAALELARQDPELMAWWKEHRAVEDALRKKLRSATPPPDFRDRILDTGRVIRGIPWYQKPWTAAAALFLALSIVFVIWWPAGAALDGFANFRSRVVSSVLRSYHMDIETDDLAQVRAFMAGRGAPADYEVPAGLARLPLTGGGLLQWRGHPVSMVCFDRGNQSMLFLFVLPQQAVPDQLPGVPQFARVNRLLTASWSQGDYIYLLAGPPEADLRDYLL